METAPRDRLVLMLTLARPDQINETRIFAARWDETANGWELISAPLLGLGHKPLFWAEFISLPQECADVIPWP